MSSTSSTDPIASTTGHGQTRRATFGRWTSRQLDTRNNSLNLVRLALALAVIWHHTFPLGGYGPSPTVLNVAVGAWAVFGFFAVSGYLITGSRLKKSFGEYLKHRMARIYPGYWVCLAATALVIAPIEYVVRTATLDGYLTKGPVTPLGYIFVNSTLRIGSYGLGDTLASNPYPSAWNGSLWTLYYEFGCYLVVGLLAVLPFWFRSIWPTLALFVATTAAYANWALVASYVSDIPDAKFLCELLPLFLGGSLIALLRDRVGLHWAGAAISLAAIVVCVRLSPLWGPQAAAPFIAYSLLWIGNTLRSPHWFRRNDLSYGVYIYAFPVQQLLSALGLHHAGIGWYTASCVVVTIGLAFASWFLVERPVMSRLRKGPSLGAASPGSTGSSAGTQLLPVSVVRG